MSTYSVPGKEFIFIIDTEQYAGNFEREMCAYLTGHIGQCGVGREEQKIFLEEMGLLNEEDDSSHPFSQVTGRTDEHGCYRPCSIWSTPGWFNDGFGGNFKEGEEDKARKHYVNYCQKEAVKDKTIEGKRRWKAMAEERHPHYESFQSVAIFMHEPPTPVQMEILIERAKKFVKYMKAVPGSHISRKITITGFRLIKEEILQEFCGRWPI